VCKKKEGYKTHKIAIYPSAPQFRFGGKNINLVENLKLFTKEFAESFKNVLSEKKRALLVRIAHVGSLGYAEGVFKSNHRIVFIPAIGEEYEAGFIGESGDVHRLVIDPLCCAKAKEGKRFTGIPALFHADPLIYYAEMESEYSYHEKTYEVKESIRNVQLSVTYGENDVEADAAWLKVLIRNRLDTTDVDAYVIFNSTFYIDDLNIDLQMIHGGFKALHWSPLGCYIDSSVSGLGCFAFLRNIHNVNEVINRVQLNPHCIRYQEYRGCFNEETILMIVGDENSWFFSLPIAPPPLYFLAQEASSKLNLSGNIIRERLGRNENEVEKRVSEVLETYGLNDLPEDIKKGLYEFLNSYYSGRASNLVVGFKNKVEEILKRNYEQYKSETNARVWSAFDLLNYFLATPQCRIGKKYDYIRKHEYIRYGNYSYLDFLISKKWYEDCINNSPNEERYRCSIAWIFGLSLLVLLDSYIRFVERAES